MVTPVDERVSTADGPGAEQPPSTAPATASPATAWGVLLDELLARNRTGSAVSATVVRGSQELADFLLAWDPPVLEWLWRTEQVRLNLTRLRALAKSLFNWREPTANVRVLEAIARQTQRPGDLELARRRAATVTALQGLDLSPAVPALFTDSLPHSLPVVTDSLVEAGISATGAADDLAGLVGRAQEEIAAQSRGSNVLGFRVEGGMYALLAGVEASRRWGAPVVEWEPGAPFIAVVEGFAEALGMGRPPVRPEYRSEQTDLYRLCAEMRDAAWEGSRPDEMLDARARRRVAVRHAGLDRHLEATVTAARRLAVLHPRLDIIVGPQEEGSAGRAEEATDLVVVVVAEEAGTETAGADAGDEGARTVRIAVDESDPCGGIDIFERLREVALFRAVGRDSSRTAARPYVAAKDGWTMAPETAEHLRRARREAWAEVTGRAVRGVREYRMPNISGWFPARDNSVAEVLTAGWGFAEFPLVSLEEPIEWDQLCLDSRSWNYVLHSWRFMDSVMREYLSTGDVTHLQWCLDRAVSWSARFVTQPPGESLAWYDMALGLRSARLAALIWAAVHADVGADVVGDLIRCARVHLAAFADPASFNPRSNHGYYVALGQTILGRVLGSLPEMAEMAAEGERRLGLMATQQFAPDGGHTEHSPDYHRMVLGSFVTAIENGLLRAPEVARRIELASHLLGWFILPNGEMLQFGDSPARSMRAAHSAAFDPHVRYLATDGEKGEPIEEELMVLPQSGYAVVRSPQPSPTVPSSSSAYLALQAGFHSRAHKHADDLSIVWFDRGTEILVDGGRYGYGELLSKESPLRREGHYYADPVRRYLESSVAHNTVTVGDVDHDRRRRPYGSALGDCAQVDDAFVVAGRVPHGDWAHERRVQLHPGERLVVGDEVSLSAATDRSITVWFNLDGELELAVEAHDLLRATHPRWGEPLWIRMRGGSTELVTPVRGSEEPFRGWRSKVDRQLVPAWNLGWRVPGAERVNLETIFEFSPEPPDGG